MVLLLVKISLKVLKLFLQLLFLLVFCFLCKLLLSLVRFNLMIEFVCVVNVRGYYLPTYPFYRCLILITFKHYRISIDFRCSMGQRRCVFNRPASREWLSIYPS